MDTGIEYVEVALLLNFIARLAKKSQMTLEGS
jgi:hypothetical protein